MRAEVYSELAKANISPSMREIQIATMLRLSMAIKVAEGTLLLECPLRSQNLAEWLQNAIRETYKIDSRIKRVSQGSGFMYCIRLEGKEAKKLLVLSRLLDRKTKRIVEGFPAFVNIALLPAATAMWRGALMAQGELSSDKKEGAKVYCSVPRLAEELKQSASILGLKTQINTKGRRKSIEVEAEQTVRLLNLLGARDWAIKVCNTYAQKDEDTRHVISQLYAANKKRSFDASQNACQRISRALTILKGKNVNPNLIEAGQLRLKYPNATLSELGRLADPPISKDALAGRMRRLYKLAMDIQEGRVQGMQNKFNAF